MTKKIVVKDKLLHDTLDLSCCELKEVPVKEISVLRRAAIVDLSNNDLVSLPRNFVTLTQIIKLDLSKNSLKELPENFGELTQLKHLDLYKNQISRLPLSLGNLKSLRWLDLKENPLTTAVASVAGPCVTEKDCQNCARNVVSYLSKVKQTFDAAEKLRKETSENEQIAETKKESEQKKKKKKADKEKNNSSNGKQSKDKQDLESPKRADKLESPQVEQGGFLNMILSAFYYTFMLCVLSLMVIPFLPNAIEIFTFIKEKTGLPIQPLKLELQVPPLLKAKAQLFYNQSRQLIEHVYQKYFV